MGLFLLSFFLIYGGFHLYFFLKIREAFAHGVAAQTLLIALLLLGLIFRYSGDSIHNYCEINQMLSIK